MIKNLKQRVTDCLDRTKLYTGLGDALDIRDNLIKELWEQNQVLEDALMHSYNAMKEYVARPEPTETIMPYIHGAKLLAERVLFPESICKPPSAGHSGKLHQASQDDSLALSSGKEEEHRYDAE